jgi:hypothetical protein
MYTKVGISQYGLQNNTFDHKQVIKHCSKYKIVFRLNRPAKVSISSSKPSEEVIRLCTFVMMGIIHAVRQQCFEQLIIASRCAAFRSFVTIRTYFKLNFPRKTSFELTWRLSQIYLQISQLLMCNFTLWYRPASHRLFHTLLLCRQKLLTPCLSVDQRQTACLYQTDQV